MKIKNFDVLAVTSARRSALLVAEAGFEAIDTGSVIKRLVEITGNSLRVDADVFSLKDIRRIFVVGVGKCAVEAGLALQEILGDLLTDGIVIDVKATTAFKKIKSFTGTHPLPSNQNVEAAKAVVSLLKNLTTDDLVIFIISGGGSTLLCLPENGDFREELCVMQTLIKAGATIQEINILRKHLSLARGGHLAKCAYPAHAASLIFSDVPGDDIEFIASGPTVKDNTTVKDAEKILIKYDVRRVCTMQAGGLVETPKDDKYFTNVKNSIAASNKIALAAMERKASELGLRPKICTFSLYGEAREVGRSIAESLHTAEGKSVLLYGGETTVTVKGHGRGGRNLELGLSALRDTKDGELVLSIASDGRDNGEFAGVICDTITKEAIAKSGLAIETVLQENDEYPLFEKIGSYLLTGDTGSNVSDLVIALKS